VNFGSSLRVETDSLEPTLILSADFNARKSIIFEAFPIGEPSFFKVLNRSGLLSRCL
jgi:hypothetical protein